MANKSSVFGIPLDDGTITASSEASGLGVSNLLDEQPKNVWRTSAAKTGVWVKYNLGAATEIGVVALLFTNLTSGATWRVKADTSEANVDGGSPAYDSGSLTAHASSFVGVDKPHCFLNIDPGETYQWWRIELDDSGNSDSYLEAGRVIFAEGFRPNRNRRYGGGRSWVDPTNNKRTAAGSIFSQEFQSYPVVSHDFAYATEAEAEEHFLQLQRLQGKKKPVFFCEDVNDATYAMQKIIYGKFEELQPVIRRRLNVFENRISIEGME